MKKNLSIFIIFATTTILSACTGSINYSLTSAEERVLTEKYNKQYLSQDFVKKDRGIVALINKYYDCKNSNKSAIEGCVAYVSNNNYDEAAINDYLSGLAKYIAEAKNNTSKN